MNGHKERALAQHQMIPRFIQDSEIERSMVPWASWFGWTPWRDTKPDTEETEAEGPSIFERDPMLRLPPKHRPAPPIQRAAIRARRAVDVPKPLRRIGAPASVDGPKDSVVAPVLALGALAVIGWVILR